MWWIIIVAVLIILVIIGVSPSAEMHAGEIDDIVDREFREQKRVNELRAEEKEDFAVSFEALRTDEQGFRNRIIDRIEMYLRPHEEYALIHPLIVESYRKTYQITHLFKKGDRYSVDDETKLSDLKTLSLLKIYGILKPQ